MTATARTSNDRRGACPGAPSWRDGARVALTCLLLTACARAPVELVFAGPTMGTTYTVKTIGAGAVTQQEIEERIDAILGTVDLEMSTYRTDSALSRFNESRSTDWYPVPEALAQVVAAAQDISAMTGGAFDVTVGPLVDLWGFGPGGTRDDLPDDAALSDARERVGYRLLEVRLDPPALKKQRPDLEVDLNAIVPGYAVDRIAAELDALDVENYLIDVGGELRARGRNAQEQSWRVAVEEPVEGLREVHTIIRLENAAVATSGDYRQYFDVDGRRYSHTLDPRTARPVEHGLASVAIVAESAMLADALATALAVLGPVQGADFVDRRGLAALFLVREDGAFVEKSTPGFERLRVEGRS
ncbi:MAG TPA: FAD:protein FMN transferase [Steroidobacteraceae bacterium]|nr:FAD:protein FMN transferase [Steroidobacteraceae bacterium]